MRRPSFIIAILFLTGVIVFLPISNDFFKILFSREGVQPSLNDQKDSLHQMTQNKIVETQSILQSLSTKQVGASHYYRLTDLTTKGIVDGEIDKINGVCHVQKSNYQLQFERDNPVVLVNGIYEPMSAPTRFLQEECYLPKETIVKLVSSSENLNTDHREKLSLNAKQLERYLSFLRSPIPGAHVSTLNSSLPGAPRDYRNGVHEGLDWYTYGTGKVIDKRTPVLSMGTGVVVRADTNYKEMTTKERNQLLEIGSNNNGQTPTYILDKLRGRTVWIQYENGIMARYCHLDRISKEIKVGTQVKTGDPIGYVGNSGTSDGALGNNRGLHLHLDIIIYGDWIWGKYNLSERRGILEAVFNK